MEDDSQTKKKSMDSREPIPKLFSDLIIDILSRMPVKDLCRFKCVSKSWFALINHPRFIKLHLDRNRHRRRLVISTDTDTLYYIDLETLTPDHESVTALELDFPGDKLEKVDHSIDSLLCIGSSNGLLCVFTQPEDVVVFNPATMECKQIPRIQNREARSLPPLLYGFCYVEAIDDYKFVKVEDLGKEVEIYSLKTNSWKVIDINLKGYEQKRFSPAVPLNGVIHWVVSKEGFSEIIALDLVKERFDVVPSPEVLRNAEGLFSVACLRDRLCLVMGRRDYRNEVWVMNEYGVKASWARVLVADPLLYLQPLCYLGVKETMLFLINMRELAFCDPKNGKFKFVELDGVCSRQYDLDVVSYEDEDEDDGGDAVTVWFDMDVFVESLVSPHFGSVCSAGGSLSFFLFSYSIAFPVTHL